MADSATTKWMARPAVSYALRYGLAIASVTGALLLELLFRYFNLPHPFAAFALSAIALTFWYAGTKPGILAVLLSSLTRGFLFEAETSSLSRVLYDLVFLLFAILMVWVRRTRHTLELTVADRTAKLTTANEELRRQKEQLDRLFELSPVAVILTDQNFQVLRVSQEFTHMFGYSPEEAVGRSLYELIVPEEFREDTLKNMALVVSGERLNLESVRRRKDGIRLDVSIIVAPLSLVSGQMTIYLIYRDITEHKKAERKLRRSEGYLAEAQRLSHTGSWAVQVPQMENVYLSKEMYRIFGLDPDTAPPPYMEGVSRRLHPEDAPHHTRVVEEAILDRTDFETDYRVLLPNGATKYIHAVGHPVVNPSGDLIELIGTAMDVTEQHEARAALQIAFEQIKAEKTDLRRMTDAIATSIYVLRPDGTALYANQTALDYTGLTLEDVQSEDHRARVFHPEDVEKLREERHAALARGAPFENEQRALGKDGKYRWFLVRYSPLRDEQGHIIRWYATGTDIEDRKRAEEALRKSEERWRSVFENSAIGVALTDLNGRFLATNQVYQTMVGYTEEELRALSFLDLTHEDYREANWALATELLEGKRRQFQIEKKYVRKDGSSIWVRNNVSLVPGTERVPRFIMALSEDVTERKRAEEALQRSEAYLAEAQRLTKTGSWAWNVRTDDLFWSQEIFRIYNYAPEMTPTWNFLLERVHPEDRPDIERRKKMESTQKEWADSEIDYRIVLPDGTIKQLHSIAHPVMDKSGEITEVVGTLIDVTERKRADAERERLRQVQADLAHVSRVTTMGELTASLAHEVRQPIAAALTDAETCLHWLGGDRPDIEKARAAATRVVKDGTRAAEVISRIRLLFNKGTPQQESVDVNHVIAEMIVLLRGETTRYSISVRTALAADLPQVIGDRVQLQQVLLNLMINSIDAMKGVKGTRELAIQSQRAENEEVVVSVTDSGVGLPPQQGDQIFNAFFTTKPHGTGMGLRISRSIIESHGGRLWAGHNSPRGAVFLFTLPTKTEEQQCHTNALQ